MADISALMTNIYAVLADISPIMADICHNGRYSLEMIFLPRWQISDQMADIPLQNGHEYEDNGPSSSTQRDFLSYTPFKREHPQPPVEPSLAITSLPPPPESSWSPSAGR